MECPVCKIPLIVIEYHKIELDYCAGCLGVWFDAGEIELLIEAAGFDPDKTTLDLEPAGKDVTEAFRHCPLCRKKMEKVSPAGTAGRVIVDRCKKGDGIWFDSGEIAEALSGSFDSADKKSVTDRILTGFLYEILFDPKDGN